MTYIVLHSLMQYRVVLFYINNKSSHFKDNTDRKFVISLLVFYIFSKLKHIKHNL